MNQRAAPDQTTPAGETVPAILLATARLAAEVRRSAESLQCTVGAMAGTRQEPLDREAIMGFQALDSMTQNLRLMETVLEQVSQALPGNLAIADPVEQAVIEEALRRIRGSGRCPTPGDEFELFA